MKIKLNTDVVLANNEGVISSNPAFKDTNYIAKLKALVYFHRQEYLTFLDVSNIGDNQGQVYCQQFDCYFVRAEYEIVREPITI